MCAELLRKAATPLNQNMPINLRKMDTNMKSELRVWLSTAKMIALLILCGFSVSVAQTKPVIHHNNEAVVPSKAAKRPQIVSGEIGFTSRTRAHRTTLQDKLPGAATGERIGNAISAAVNTAFPIIPKILDVIWPNRANDPNKKLKAAEAEKNLEDARKQALDKQKTNFEEIKKISDDLATVRSFMAACIEADRKVISMQALLGEKKVLVEKDKNALNYLWTEADSRLQELKSADMTAKIDTMGDPFVQLALRAVRDTNLGLTKNITDQIKSGDGAALRRSLDDLEPRLSAVGALAAQLIGNISSSLKTLPDRIGGALGGVSEDDRAKNDNEILQNRLLEMYSIKKQ